jgi:GntR family transcriptional regulator
VVTDSGSLLVQIQPTDTRPIYVQIMDEVRRAVALGDIEPEDALPSVRELARRLHVNPNTVSQAYRELESEGMVYVRRGRGTFVAPDADRADERESLVREVADRALREAYRYSLSPEELIEAVRQQADRHGEEGSS